MFEGLKKKYIDYQISKIWKNQNRSKQFINWNDVKSVMIIYDQATLKKETKDYVISKLNGRQFFFWTSVESSEMKKETVNTFMVSPKDTNLLNKPKDDVVKRFLNVQCDILIDLTLTENLPLKYLTAVSKSKCKCGLAKDDDNLLDFKIQLSKGNVKDLFDQIIHYLEIIKTK